MCIPYILIKKFFWHFLGEDGYAKIMANNGLGVCGTNQTASYPIIVADVRTIPRVTEVEVVVPTNPVDVMIKK